MVPGTYRGRTLPGIRATAGGTVFSQTEVLAVAIAPFLGHLPTEPAGGCHILVSINLDNTVGSPWGFPETKPYPTSGATQALSSDFSIQMTISTFYKISQISNIWPQSAL